MPFRFSTANTKHLLSLPLYLIVFSASRLIPRNRRLWVFGRKGAYGGNSRYQMDYIRRYRPEVTCIWLAHSPAELAAAREDGARAELINSMRGWRAALRAKVGVVSFGLGDINRLASGGMFVVQLWHGSPLKRLGLDTEVTFATGKGSGVQIGRWIVKKLYRYAFSRYSLMTAPSQLVRRRFQSAFGLPTERVAVTGDPKTDIILAPSSEPTSAFWQTKMRQDLGIPRGAKIVMYAPTWREDSLIPILPPADIIEQLEAVLQKANAWLVVRAHHAHQFLEVGSEDSHPPSMRRVRHMSGTEFPDVNYLLSDIAAMITDYSSICIDFALLGRPTLFYAPDLENYVGSRGLYEPYETFTGNHWTTTWPELIDDLDECLNGDDTRFIATARQLARRYDAFRDTANRERIFTEVQRRLRRPGAADGKPASEQTRGNGRRHADQTQIDDR